MTYEEREKQLCRECRMKETCPYIPRKMEYKCQHLSDTMYGWELGWQDAITKAIEWLYQRQAVDLEVSDIEKFIEDFKNYMKGE